MRVAFVHRTRATGVEAVHIRGIVESLQRMGHEVRLFGPSMESEFVGGRSDGRRPSVTGLIVSHVPEAIFELLELAHTFTATIMLLWGRRAFRYDIIYERYSIFGAAGAIVSNILCLPMVLEVNYTSASPLVRRRSAVLKPLARLLDRFIFRTARRLACVSSWLAEEVIRDFGAERGRVVVVPNAADPEAFKPMPCVQNEDSFTVGFVGGFFPWHGVHLLVDALALLRQEGHSIKAIFVGDGPERSSIEKRISALGLEGVIELAGKVSHANLPSVIARFDVGVMPDSNEYGSPMKIFEYMAVGKPVVAPDYVPILDAYVDGIHGFIFPRRDAKALASCLRRACTEPQLLRSMGEAARRLILEQRNWMRNTELSLEGIGPS